MSQWAYEEQPRYRLEIKGTDALSTPELISILLQTGTREKSALQLAHELFEMYNQNLVDLAKRSITDLSKLKGIGAAKATLLIAAFELGRRRQCSLPSERIIITNSKDIGAFLRTKLQDYPYEVFAIIYLNQGNRVKHFEIVSKGGITGTVVDIRLVLKKALEIEATSLILSHNHPSGSLRPSRADEDLTNKIKSAALCFDIAVLDHIIVSEAGYFSFADEGRL